MRPPVGAGTAVNAPHWAVATHRGVDGPSGVSKGSFLEHLQLVPQLKRRRSVLQLSNPLKTVWNGSFQRGLVMFWDLEYPNKGYRRTAVSNQGK